MPVLLVHGNLSTGRFYRHVMSGAPDHYRLMAPSKGGFGRTERAPIDATPAGRRLTDRPAGRPPGGRSSASTLGVQLQHPFVTGLRERRHIWWRRHRNALRARH